MKKTRKQLMKALSDIQDKAGRAKGVAMNDRSPDRAEKLLPLLDEIFEIALNHRDWENSC